MSKEKADEYLEFVEYLLDAYDATIDDVITKNGQHYVMIEEEEGYRKIALPERFNKINL